jgi:Matrixin
MREVWVGLTLLAALAPRMARAWEHELDPVATWRGEVPYAVHWPVAPGLRAALREELPRALQAWRSGRCLGPGVRELGTTEREPDVSLEGADGHTVIGFAEKTWPYGEGVAAVTRLRVEHGVIVEADLLLNAVEYEWHLEPVPRGSRRLHQLGPTLRHELGHVWGLGHSMDRAAVMHANELHELLAPDDVEGLCALYPSVPPPPAAPGGWWRLIAPVGVGIALWRLRRRQKQARVSAPPR